MFALEWDASVGGVAGKESAEMADIVNKVANATEHTQEVAQREKFDGANAAIGNKVNLFQALKHADDNELDLGAGADRFNFGGFKGGADDGVLRVDMGEGVRGDYSSAEYDDVRVPRWLTNDNNDVLALAKPLETYAYKTIDDGQFRLMDTESGQAIDFDGVDKVKVDGVKYSVDEFMALFEDKLASSSDPDGYVQLTSDEYEAAAGSLRDSPNHVNLSQAVRIAEEAGQNQPDGDPSYASTEYANGDENADNGPTEGVIRLDAGNDRFYFGGADIVDGADGYHLTVWMNGGETGTKDTFVLKGAIDDYKITVGDDFANGEMIFTDAETGETVTVYRADHFVFNNKKDLDNDGKLENYENSKFSYDEFFELALKSPETLEELGIDICLENTVKFQFDDGVSQEYCLDFTDGFGFLATYTTTVTGPNGEQEVTETQGVQVVPPSLSSLGIDDFGVGAFLNAQNVEGFVDKLLTDPDFVGVDEVTVDYDAGTVSFLVQGTPVDGEPRGQDKVVLKGVGTFLPAQPTKFEFGDKVAQEYCLDFTKVFDDDATDNLIQVTVTGDGPNGLVETFKTTGLQVVPGEDAGLSTIGIDDFGVGATLFPQNLDEFVDKLLTDPDFVGVSDVTVDRDEGSISFLVQGTPVDGMPRGQDKVTLKGVGEFLDNEAVPNSIVGALADPDITEIKIDFDPDGDGIPASDRREDLEFTFDGETVPSVTVIENSYLYGNSDPIGHGEGDIVRDLFGGSVGPTDGDKIVEFANDPKPLGGLVGEPAIDGDDLMLTVDVGGNFGPDENTIEITGLDLTPNNDMV